MVLAVLTLTLSIAAGPAAQTPPPLSGIVTDATGLPLPGATVAVAKSSGFVVTDERGAFTLAAVQPDAEIVVSMPGFTERRLKAPADRSQIQRIALALSGLSEVVAVTAAAPPSAAQSIIPMSPLDIVRTPGTQADLMRALGTQPGVAQIDDGAGLFVRGGDVSEVLVLFDGVVVSHPYRYESPTGGFRGAVDPFLTAGAAFTTGGFSAIYGNSLSAVVDLQGLGRPRGRQATVTAGLAGISATVSQPLGSRAGIRFAANRTTPSLLFSVNPSPKQFDRLPGGWDISGSATLDSPRLGSLRVTSLMQGDHVGVELEKDAFVGFLHSATRHELGIARWSRGLSSRWLAEISLGADRYTKNTDVGVISVDEREQHRSGRAQASGDAFGWTVRLGVDSDVIDTRITGFVPTKGGDLAGVSGSSVFDIAHRDWRAGAFATAARSFGRLTPEFGIRADRFDAAQQVTADPRVSIRAGLGGANSIRLSAGLYHQAPSPEYFDSVRGAARLEAMSSTHVVAGVEHGKTDGPVFARLEVYQKRYTALPLDAGAGGFTSDGYGSARGLDLYVRRLTPKVDLKVSASLLQARRRWTSADQQDRFPLPDGTWAPDFDIPYSAQAVANVNLTGSLSMAASWRVAAGRPFTPAIGSIKTTGGFEPVWASINSERLPRYDRVDLSISLLKPAGSSAVVYFASVDNLFNHRNAFEAAYSADYSTRRLVSSSSPRSFYVGCSITR